jgi:hypothetical protein
MGVERTGGSSLHFLVGCVTLVTLSLLASRAALEANLEKVTKKDGRVTLSLFSPPDAVFIGASSQAYFI